MVVPVVEIDVSLVPIDAVDDAFTVEGVSIPSVEAVSASDVFSTSVAVINVDVSVDTWVVSGAFLELPVKVDDS